MWNVVVAGFWFDRKEQKECEERTDEKGDKVAVFLNLVASET